MRRMRLQRSLYEEVKEILKECGETETWLEAAMVASGIKFPPRYMDAQAKAPDIYLIAEILDVPPRRLFEATRQVGEIARASFNELWSRYENQVGLSKDKAFERVVHYQFKWNESSRLMIYARVKAVLEGLAPPTRKIVGCQQWLDCECVTRCESTGRLIGPD